MTWRGISQQPIDCHGSALPAVGAVSSPAEVPETRIEAIYPRSRRSAALSVHPYETPAFMTFPVDGSLPD